MQRSTYFVKIELFPKKFCWSEVSIGEFFLDMQNNQYVEGVYFGSL